MKNKEIQFHLRWSPYMNRPIGEEKKKQRCARWLKLMLFTRVSMLPGSLQAKKFPFFPACSDSIKDHELFYLTETHRETSRAVPKKRENEKIDGRTAAAEN